MDPAPRPFEELPLDSVLGVPVPFACGTGADADATRLDHRRVTQCALSRICGVCGESLARPVAFLGSVEEADRNAFHFPPSHVQCAETALELWSKDSSAALGYPSPPEAWAVVTTSGFEYIRPTPDTEDGRSVFSPNSVIDDRRLPQA